ncbi:lactocin 705-alpha family bacteriocin [Enterococcus asini]|nr:hypothetical protein DWV91_07170 [Enterococcus asini]
MFWRIDNFLHGNSSCNKHLKGRLLRITLKPLNW